jgi:hypothetical protein
MNCFCCANGIELAKKVKIRRLIECTSPKDSKDSIQYMAYVEETTYRWSVICVPCYLVLDNRQGGDEINGQFFTIAACSRNDKARLMDSTAYQKWQVREAAKIGMDLGSS